MKSLEKEYLNEMIQEKDRKGIIVEFQTSILIEKIDTFYSNNGKFDEKGRQNFEKIYSVPHIICKNIKVIDYFIHREIYYRNNKLLSNPKNVEFIDLNLVSKTYKIYNIQFIYDLIEKLNFTNPVIVCKQKELPFYNSIESIFGSWENDFQIVNKKIIDYSTYFQKRKGNDEKTNKNSFPIKIASDLTPNFKYYFKYPNPEESFNFISSSLRSEIFSSLLNNKISGLCGPMGIGKSTTLLALSRMKENYCYFNIKSLNDHQDQLFIWKDELILLEVAHAMRYNYPIKKFKELIKKLENVCFYWEAIISIIEYFIKAKIKIIMILDQYKEKFDHNYENIKTISDILEADSKNMVSIIISSSINDKDVRNSLIFQWLKDKNSNNIFEYKYYNILINIIQNITSDKTLTEKKRKMIVDDFNSIPKFYYAIKTLNDADLDDYKNLQIAKITTSINEFFEETKGILGKINTLITLRGSFGNNLEKQQFQELIKILPFKYFTFNLTNFTIDFSFPLVKDIFDDFLSDKICCFLKSPISSLKEGTIGDILELNLINDLKKNSFCKFDQIIKVDSIWNLSQIKSISTLNESKNILLIQENTEAKYLDFGIINEENLILYQCKKALKKVPDSFVTRQKIESHKNILKQQCLNFLNVSIKQIYLFYVTGITFFKKNNELKVRTWGIDEKEDFSSNITIANAAKSELFYYDVVNRRICFENNLEYEFIDNIITHAIKFSSPILLEPKKELEMEVDKLELLENNEKSQLSERIKKINRDCDVPFFTQAQMTYLKNYNKEIINNNIIGYIKNPKSKDLKFSRMLGLKRGNKNYLLIEKLNNERKSNYKRNTQEENEQENGEENKDSYLVLLKDDGIEEVKTLSNNFYNTIDYAYIFEKNILLKDQ